MTLCHILLERRGWVNRTTITITVTLMYHSFLVRTSICLSFCILSFSRCGLPGQQNPSYGKFSFFLIAWSGLLVWIQWSVCISKFFSLFRTESGLCMHHLEELSSLNFWHNSQHITFPTKSCLVFYSFSVCLLYYSAINCFISITA